MLFVHLAKFAVNHFKKQIVQTWRWQAGKIPPAFPLVVL